MCFEVTSNSVLCVSASGRMQRDGFESLFYYLLHAVPRIDSRVAVDCACDFSDNSEEERVAVVPSALPVWAFDIRPNLQCATHPTGLRTLLNICSTDLEDVGAASEVRPHCMSTHR